MADTVKLEHLVNETLQRLDRQSTMLNGNILKSTETLRKLSLDQEAAMNATQAAREETSRLKADIDAAWQAHEARVLAADAGLQARLLAVEQRERDAQAAEDSAVKASDESRLALAEHRQAVEEARKRVASLVEQMQTLLKPFLPTPTTDSTLSGTWTPSPTGPVGA